MQQKVFLFAHFFPFSPSAMNKTQSRNIVILGAGVAGIRVAQDLSKKLAGPDYSIILIDRNDFHVFQSDLYEVATAFNEKITDECLINLKATVATPIKNLVDFKRVKFLKDEIVDILHESKEVILKHEGKLHYDYLVVALGSDTNYFDIPGLKKYSFPLKTVQDAIKINCHLDQLFHDFWKRKNLRDINIVVGGGGATGVETAAELVNFVECLTRKYDFSLSRVKIQLIERSDKLVGLPKNGTDIILKRFRRLGIEVYLERSISAVTKSQIITKLPDNSLKEIFYDFFIWTGGAMIAPIVQKAIGSPLKHGAMPVNPFLQSEHDRNIFVAGDAAYYNWDGNFLPMLAQIAYYEGTLVAKNIVALIKGKELTKFRVPNPKILIPLGGKYAIFICGKHIFKGFFPWLLKRVVYFKYALSILPFFKALRKFTHSTKVFVEND